MSLSAVTFLLLVFSFFPAERADHHRTTAQYYGSANGPDIGVDSGLDSGLDSGSPVSVPTGCREAIWRR